MAFAGFGYQLHVEYHSAGSVKISNPQTAQYFFDTLGGKPRDYTINAQQPFDLHIGLLVPEGVNPDGKYSAEIFDTATRKDVLYLDGQSATWTEWYDNMTREYYLKGPAYQQQLPAGNYTIEIASAENAGSYVMQIGGNQTYAAGSMLNDYWQIPLLQYQFFKTSPVQFLFTPLAIGGIAALGVLIVILLFLSYLLSIFHERRKHVKAKTLLLTSNGMDMKDEIVKLLQKPAYDTNVAFIMTAAKGEEDQEYMKRDLFAMKEIGFNVEEIDIEGKSASQVKQLLELKDIIFVEGGNTFYLLAAMRRCNFEKIIRELLELGIVYIGASAGSIVAGKTIQTASNFGTGGDANNVKMTNMKGLNLVPFDIFVHYTPDQAAIIQQKIPNPKKRAKQLKVLADGQAILIQGKETYLLGKGEEITV